MHRTVNSFIDVKEKIFKIVHLFRSEARAAVAAAPPPLAAAAAVMSTRM